MRVHKRRLHVNCKAIHSYSKVLKAMMFILPVSFYMSNYTIYITVR